MPFTELVKTRRRMGKVIKFQMLQDFPVAMLGKQLDMGSGTQRIWRNPNIYRGVYVRVYVCE